MRLAEPTRRRVAALALGLATVACFLPTLGNGFVDFDDGAYVTRNPQVQAGLSAAGARWALTARVSSNWHPLTLLSHMLDCSLYGLDPRGHHLSSLLLHAANVGLLFLLLVRLGGGLRRAAAVAALWGLHPLRVESVAWVAERKDVLSGFCFLLALLAYERWARQGSRPAYAGLLVAAALGLAAKPMLVTLPFVLLLLDFWPLGRLRLARPIDWTALRALVLEKLPLFALSAASALLTIGAQADVVIPGGRLGLAERLANAAVAIVAYLRLTLWPRGLAVLYPLVVGRPVGVVVSAAGLVLGVTWLAWAARRQAPFLLTGWLWFLGMLVPVLGIVQVGAQGWADRYTYLPGIGLVLALVWGFALLAARWPRTALPLLAAALLAVSALAVATRAQIVTWRSDLTLWRRAAAVTRDNFQAHLNLATDLMLAGDRAGALAHYREALRIAPGSMEVQAGLGSALQRWGEPAAALQHLRAAVRLRPDDPRPHVSLAAVLADLGQREDAIAELHRALALAPGLAPAEAGLRALGAAPP